MTDNYKRPCFCKLGKGSLVVDPFARLEPDRWFGVKIILNQLNSDDHITFKILIGLTCTSFAFKAASQEQPFEVFIDWQFLHVFSQYSILLPNWIFMYDYIYNDDDVKVVLIGSTDMITCIKALLTLIFDKLILTGQHSLTTSASTLIPVKRQARTQTYLRSRF